MLAELVFSPQRLDKMWTGEGKKRAEGPLQKGMKKALSLRRELAEWEKTFFQPRMSVGWLIWC